MGKLNPKMTQDEFESLHEAVDQARGKTVKVSKEALYHLLMDHSSLWATLGVAE